MSGQTFAQLLKRPEVPVEEIAPVLRERLKDYRRQQTEKVIDHDDPRVPA